jgi:hypothetical protein
LNSLAWRLQRTAARRYPVLPYRDRPRFFRWSPDEIFEGIVGTRAGVRVRVTGDPQYYSVFFRGDYESYHAERSPDHPTVDDRARCGHQFRMVCNAFCTVGRASWFRSRLRTSAVYPQPRHRHYPGQQLHFASEIESGRSRSRARLDDDSYIRGSPRGHSTVAPLGREDVVAANGCEVPTLDDYCDENRVPRRRFQKVDVEGAELVVYIGTTPMLAASSAPIVAFEING